MDTKSKTEVGKRYGGQRAIEGAFIIKNEEIDLFGAMVKGKAGNREVHGRVLIGNSVLLFHHTGESKDVLIEKMQKLCGFIAGLYAAEVIYHEYDEAVELGEIVSLN
jgi:hypothetical protein